ncbi:hypothetical protein GWI33_012478 [Rhynchophorus ferrugineus]|uniref:Uncharacterized protein n=1 Tax=Rhynchophorus ferrugineus TaxID=354439 RepID=A0A834I5C2_RHYFE|nr:hypothetical protein GWI33_012478 [Rhynchophorus ferrugineus]
MHRHATRRIPTPDTCEFPIERETGGALADYRRYVVVSLKGMVAVRRERPAIPSKQHERGQRLRADGVASS